MLRAGSVKVGSHLASPVLPEARGGILLHASLPPVPPSRLLHLSRIAGISTPNNQPVFSPRSVCSASRPGGCWRGWRGPSEPDLLRSIPPLASPSIWPARPLGGGVPVGPRWAGQRLTLLPGVGRALAPLSPPEVWAAKHPSLVKLLLCAPLM